MDIFFGILFVFNALLIILGGLDIISLKAAFPLLCLQNIIMITLFAALQKEV